MEGALLWQENLNFSTIHHGDKRCVCCCFHHSESRTIKRNDFKGEHHHHLVIFALYPFNIKVITAGEILQALGRELRVLVNDC
jgi:hypothetical protein